MTNQKFIQSQIDKNQSKVDLYSSQAVSAEGDEHKELLDRVIHHQQEINNYKQIQEQLKC